MDTRSIHGQSNYWWKQPQGTSMSWGRREIHLLVWGSELRWVILFPLILFYFFFFLFNFWQKQKELGALCKRHLVHKWLQRSNQFMEKRILCHRKNSCKWKRKRISWLGNEGARSFLFTKQNQTKSEASVRKAHELFNNRRTRDVVLFHWMQISYWILHKIN